MGRPITVTTSRTNASEFESDVYGPGPINEFKHQRIVYLSGDVNEHSISHVVTQLVSLANFDSVSPIQLIVSTYGGSVDEMFSLYDTLKFLPCPVNTIGLGKIMSAGVLLLASGTKGKRAIGANARVMIHPVSSGAGGTIFDMINDVAEVKRQQEHMCEKLVAETGMTKDKLESIMRRGHDVYLTPKEAVELGIVDKIIGE